MTDTAIQTEQTNQTPPAAPAVTEAPKMTAYIGDDGALRDGWRDAFVPTEYRGRKVFETVNDINGLMKLVANQESYIGRLQGNNKPLFVPGEKATPEEREAFYKALGRPDNADGYKLAAPEDLASHYDGETLKAAATEFHKLGLTPQQVEGIMAFDAARTRTAMEQMNTTGEQAKTNAEKTLRGEWKDQFDTNIHEANRVITAMVPEAERPELLSALGNNPTFARFLVKIAPAFSEGAAPSRAGMQHDAKSVESELNELGKTPGFLDGSLRIQNRAEHDRIVNRRTELYNQLYPGQTPKE